LKRLRKSVEALARIVERTQLTQRIEKIIDGNGHPPNASIRQLFTPQSVLNNPTCHAWANS
jgi:hypothetical protein